jgi:signal transduction histidine kinase
LDVRDNGRGRLADLHASDHFGVPGMRERAQALGGSFELRQVEPTGVHIVVRLPVHHHQQQELSTP